MNKTTPPAQAWIIIGPTSGIGSRALSIMRALCRCKAAGVRKDGILLSPLTILDRLRSQRLLSRICRTVPALFFHAQALRTRCASPLLPPGSAVGAISQPRQVLAVNGSPAAPPNPALMPMRPQSSAIWQRSSHLQTKYRVCGLTPSSRDSTPVPVLAARRMPRSMKERLLPPV